MVRRILTFMEREIRGLHEAAYLLAFFALLSQLLALLRDRSFAHVFGAGVELDIYFAAFRIPDVAFAALTLFVSSFALIPLMGERTDSERRSLVYSVLVVFGGTAAVLSALLFFFVPILTPRLFPGFTPDAILETSALARIMLLQPILLGLSSIASAWVQATRRFMLFALAPIFYNAGIIVGILVLYPALGLPGLAWGVVLGALFHLGIQVLPSLGHLFPHERPRFAPLQIIIRTVVLPSVPRSLALMSQQSLLVAFASIASLISAGSIAAHTLAWNLSTVPITIVAVSYASALFPALVALNTAGDRAGFARELWVAVRHLAFWLLPASMLFIVLRAHAVRVVLGTGAFSWDDTRITAAIVALFAISLLAQALILVLSRAYYAVSKPLLPILMNVSAALGAGVLAYVLVAGAATFEFLRFFVEALFRVGDVPGTLVLMIPAAYAVVQIIAACFFIFFGARTFGVERSTLQSVGTSFSASVIGAGVAYLTLQAFGPLLPTYTFLGIFAQGAVAGCAGLGAWVIVLWVLRSTELSDVLGIFVARISRMYGSTTHT